MKKRCIINRAVFVLSDAHTETITRWEEKLSKFGAENPYRPRIFFEDAWGQYEQAARLGDNEAMNHLERWGSQENWQRVSQIQQEGKTAAFNRENAARLRDDLVPIVRDIRAAFQAKRADYLRALAPWTTLYGTVPPVSDAILAKIDWVLGACESFLADKLFHGEGESGQCRPLSHYCSNLLTEIDEPDPRLSEK